MHEQNYRDYLNKTFLEELNYKIWTTKGCRFNANSRLVKEGKLSYLTINMISVYLTITGLLSVYNISSNIIDNRLLAYLVTSLSILALLFGQIETSKEYKLKAKGFHDCGLELSELYNKLRIFKTLEETATQERKIEFAKEIAESYQRVLDKYENHLQIDNDIFKTQTAKYHELNCLQVFWYRLNYYFHSFFLYHILIIAPAIFISLLIIYRN